MNTSLDPDSAPTPVGALGAVSLDCPDPRALADFYAALLGMKQIAESPDGNVVAISAGGVAVAFMKVEDYLAPTWPEPGQLQQIHLDVSVTDLPVAVDRALELGARLAQHQAGPDRWRVLLDPAGHPFCLTTVGA